MCRFQPLLNIRASLYVYKLCFCIFIISRFFEHTIKPNCIINEQINQKFLVSYSRHNQTWFQLSSLVLTNNPTIELNELIITIALAARPNSILHVKFNGINFGYNPSDLSYLIINKLPTHGSRPSLAFCFDVFIRTKRTFWFLSKKIHTSHTS